MFKGNRRTAKRESEVNARAGVKSPPSKVNVPNETTVTITGMLFNMKLLHCKTTYKEIISSQRVKVIHMICA